ncbi:MAG: preprotein translocase subunit YajC [Veillonellaceae bacterium]|nr:preprotein translocase subunit YajC [Veillonellaceae bacterium]
MDVLMGYLRAGWPILLMIVIFYFLLYRPQKKQQKERNTLLNSLKKGQRIITIGGIYGVINELKDDVVTLEIAEHTEIRVSRTSIAQILNRKADNKKA